MNFEIEIENKEIIEIFKQISDEKINEIMQVCER